VLSMMEAHAGDVVKLGWLRITMMKVCSGTFATMLARLSTIVGFMLKKKKYILQHATLIMHRASLASLCIM